MVLLIENTRNNSVSNLIKSNWTVSQNIKVGNIERFCFIVKIEIEKF